MAAKKDAKGHREYTGGDPIFLKACQLGGVAATRRQWKRYNHKMEPSGLAYAHKKEAQQFVEAQKKVGSQEEPT